MLTRPYTTDAVVRDHTMSPSHYCIQNQCVFHCHLHQFVQRPSKLVCLTMSAAAVGDLRRAHVQRTFPEKYLNTDTEDNLELAVRRDQRLRCFRHWPIFWSSTPPGSVVGWDLLYGADQGMIDDKTTPGIAAPHRQGRA